MGVKNILIVASSARLLAQFASNEGFLPLTIDCFADLDTMQVALESFKVKTLSVEHIKEAIFLLNKRYHISHIMYGSGLENHLSTLKYLEKNFTVVGNSFDVFSSIQDKRSFFLALKKKNIAYPETRFQPPKSHAGWLLKLLKGEGGLGIKRYVSKLQNTGSSYWQKYCIGIPKSVLFIANGSEYKIIGFHKQYFTQIGDNDFIFSGVINQPEVNEAVVHRIKKILDSLVTEYSLKGINSLDFIEKNDQCHVLEINARPSASLNLYHTDLFSQHINSCLLKGEIKKIIRLKNYQAYKIVFAETETKIGHQLIWPQWSRDIPHKGVIIKTGMPICSIIAGGKNKRQVERLLLLRQQQLIKILK